LLGTQGEGVFAGAAETVAAGDLFGEGRDQAVAVDGEAELGVDAGEQVGDVQGGAGLLEYVESHVNLGQTFLARRTGGGCGSVAEAADGAQLGVEGGFKSGKDYILEVIIHGKLRHRANKSMPYLRLSVNTDK
jgi:hypothetical protein